RNAVERVCLGCFGLRVLRAARRVEPAIATNPAREEVGWALYRSWCHSPASRGGYAWFPVAEGAGRPHLGDTGFLPAAHRTPGPLQVWTVDDERDARRLLGWGVDALITDRPDIMVPVVRDYVRTRT